MTASRLRLNPTKNRVLWLGSKFQIERVDIRQVPTLSSAVNVVNTARDLGVTIDSRLTMADQVVLTCRSAYFQLRQQFTAVDHQVTLFPCRKSSRTGVHHCAGWTTAIRCCLASLTTNSSDYKPSSTLQRAGVRSSSLGPHHTSLATATLAPGQAARGIQTGQSDVQNSPWTLTAVPVWWLSASYSYRTSPA